MVIISKIIEKRRESLTQEQLDKIEHNKEIRVKVIDKTVMFIITLMIGTIIVVKIVKLFL
ncbi:hypothetical protein D3C71_964080 [compost metagenome]